MLNPTPDPKRREEELDQLLAEVDVRPDEADRRWARAERTDEAARERRREAEADFWRFDALYFPPAVYRNGYAAPSDFHRDLAARAQDEGLHVVLAARKHGKTVTMKKVLAWLLLSGQVQVAGVMSQTLTTATNLLGDVRRFIQNNPRITYDYEPTFTKANDEQVQFHTEHDAAQRFCSVFSEGRSMRGSGHGFIRPEFVLCDDLETRESSLSERSVERRAKFLAESYDSLAEESTLVALGNNFSRRCLMNRLKRRREEGALPADWTVSVYPAWTEERGPLWPERYPDANSEAALRAVIDPYDEEVWSGEYQQQPQPPSGRFFKRKHLTTYAPPIPPRARGVLYCDPNLAKKGKGDTTAVVALFYDAAADRYLLAPTPRCKSYSSSRELLDDVLAFKRRYGHRLAALGFDGHVTQESTWTDHVRSWCRERGVPYPRVDYKRYRVSDLAKNTQGDFEQQKIQFPEGFGTTQEGRRFLAQLFAFTGRKTGGGAKDDAPDALICAHEFLHERLSVRPGQSQPADPIVIHDPISF